MPSAGFEPTNPTTERQQTYALDRAATGIGVPVSYPGVINSMKVLEPDGSALLIKTNIN
jgi:hypothetical protein